MKKLYIVAQLLSCALILTSCAVSMRDCTETAGIVIQDMPTDTASTSDTAEDSSDASEAGTAAETAPDTVSDNSGENTVETAVETTAVTTDESTVVQTEPPVTPTEQSAATYSPKTLMYHLILDEVYGPYEKLFVRPSEFETHLAVLDELGYEYLFAEEWRLTEKPSVIITLDDGYEDNYTEMFPILKSYSAKATVFLVTDLIGTDGYMTRDMIREMLESGLVSFQCHTAHHRDLCYMSETELRADFDESCKIIEDITGKPVRAIAYPAGSYNDTVVAVCDEYFDFAYTTKSPFSTPAYTALTIPRYYIARGYGRDMFLNYVRY